MPKTKGSMSSKPFQLVLLGVGALMVMVAIAAAAMPIDPVAEVLDRLGMDKGPLAAFGLSFLAIGTALGAIERTRRDASAALSAAQGASQGVHELDGQMAVLAGLQAEVGAVRAEVAQAREAQELARREDAEHQQTNDPLFRLAASLDQLGARIDRRVDGARREVLELVQGLAGSVEVGARQSENAAAATEGGFRRVQEDIDALQGRMNQIAGEMESALESLQSSVVAIEPAVEAEMEPESASEIEPDGPRLPRELDERVTEAADESDHDDDSDVEDSALEVAVTEEPSVPDSDGGWGLAMEQPEVQRSDAPVEEEVHPSFEEDGGVEASMPEPPAPIPAPMPVSMPLSMAEEPEPEPVNELRLIDEMDDDTARLADLTPPLFPDMDRPQD